jgi:hypothetical protein
MNEKYAKNLRKQAVHMASAMVEHGRTVSTERLYQPQSNMNPSTVINRTDTLRGIYRYLKKNDAKAK